MSRKDENGNLDVESALEPLDYAYDVAKKKANQPDIDLNNKKEEIRSKLENVKSQLSSLTDNAEKALEKIR